MSRHWLYLSCFLLLPVLYFFTIPISLGDLAIWVAQGEHFLRTGQVLRHDIYSVLPTRALVYPWGVCAVYGILNRLGGIQLVSVFHKLILFAFLGVTYHFSLGKLKSPRSDVWTPRNLLLTLVFWNGAAILCIDRPAMLAILPFAISFGILCQQTPLNRREVIGLGAIEVVWANLHGSWILLPAMMMWRAFFRSLNEKRVIWREWSASVAVLLAALINPFGWHIWTHVFQTVSDSKARGIDEWLPTGLLGPYFPQGIWFYFLLLCFIAFIYFKIRKGTPPWLVLSSPYTLLMAMGPQAIRNTTWAFLGLLPYAASQGLLTETTADNLTNESARQRSLNMALVLGVLGATLFCSPYLKPHIAGLLPKNKRAVFGDTRSFELAEAIRKTGLQAPIFNEWAYGSFLAYALPNHIFIDTRNIIYSKKQFGTYLAVLNAKPGWQHVIQEYGIRFIFLKKHSKTRLLQELAASKDWKVLAQDDNAIVFFR